MKPSNLLAIAALMVAPAFAGTVSLTGSLDPLDPNTVLTYQFTTAGAGAFLAQSYGFGGTAQAPGGTNAAGAVIPSGGFDTYLSLFTGHGPTATFLLSNDDGSCPPGNDAEACHDSTIDIANLPAGQYTLVLAVFLNMSFAENLGVGTLGDGFIGLGNYFDNTTGTDRTSAWALDVTGQFPSANVPEPSTALLCAAGVGLLFCLRR